MRFLWSSYKASFRQYTKDLENIDVYLNDVTPEGAPIIETVIIGGHRDLENSVIAKLEKISQSKGVDFILSVSLDEDELPESVKKNVLVSL
jgi:hypothetical protein